MSHAATFTRRRETETTLGIMRHRYSDLVQLAKKHAAIAQDYAEQARRQRDKIERNEQELRDLDRALANGQ